jgi:hypothetical protein
MDWGLSVNKEMIEIILDCVGYQCGHSGKPDEDIPGGCPNCWSIAEDVTESLIAAGYGKLPVKED